MKALQTINNIVIPGNKRKLEVIGPGTYAVRVKDANNCVSAFSADFNYAVSGRKDELKTKFSLYPNPTAGLLILEMQTAQPIEIVIFNPLGRQVLQKTVPQPDEKVTLDLSHAAKGLYLVQVKTEKEIEVKRIVVQ